MLQFVSDVCAPRAGLFVKTVTVGLALSILPLTGYASDEDRVARTTLSGTVEERHYHAEGGAFSTTFLFSSSGNLYAIGDDPLLTNRSPGTALRLSAVVDKDAPVPTLGSPRLEEDNLWYLAEGEAASNNSSVEPDIVEPLGEQHTAVLLVNFADNPDQMPFDHPYVEDAVFGAASDFIREASYGKTWLSGEVYGWYTLPIQSTCSSLEITEQADAIATSAGVDFSGYDRIVYVIKSTASCFWSGASNMGVYPSRAWLNGTLNTKVIAHELGHGFGLQHSNILDCQGQVFGDNCTLAQDDKFDTMGSAEEAAHYNAFQKERLGWLDEDSIATLEGDGSITLQPLEVQDGPYPNAIKVYRGIDAESGNAQWFYLEYRQAIGWDSFLATNSNVQNGILVHTGIDARGGSSVLLDMTPDSRLLDRTDPALEEGNSFYDAHSGVTFTTAYADGANAVVTVLRDIPGCVVASAGLQVNPDVAFPAAAGSAMVFELVVANNDSSACPETKFQLSVEAPGNWQNQFDNETLLIGPESSAASTLTVNVPETAADGVYPLNVVISRSGVNGDYVSKVIQATISNPVGNSMPVATPDTAEVEKGSSVKIDILVNDFDPDGDAISLLSVEQPAKGVVTVNTDRSITYTPGKRFKSVDSFTYTISDGQQSAEASVSVALAEGGTKPSGGGGKGRMR